MTVGSEHPTDVAPSSASTEGLPSEPIPASRMRQMARGAVMLPLLVMSALCIVLLWDVGVLARRYSAIEHTRQVIGQINLAQRLLVDQETGVRAYLLLGDAQFLEPYDSGRTALPGTFDAMASLVSDNPAQRARLDALRGRYEAWLKSVEATKEDALRRELWTQPADAVLRKHMIRRKVEMDAMRVLTTAMIDEEERLLAERTAVAGRSIAITQAMGAILALVFGTIVAVSSVRRMRWLDTYYRLALREREKSEASERKARQAAEALASDIAQQSREMERRFAEMRDDYERIRGQRPAEGD